MRFRAITIALATTALGLVGAAPAAALNYTTRCSNNVCEQVANAYKGSDYVDWVYIYDRPNPKLEADYAVLVDGYVRATSHSYGGPTYSFGYNVNSGRCIQGLIYGIPDGTTPCWYAP